MKFNHKFALVNKEFGVREYKSDNINTRLDFIGDSAIRVAIYKDNEPMLATYNVAPDNKMANTGRDRLSLDGFNIIEPVEQNDSFVLPCGVSVQVDTDNFLLSYSLGDKIIFADRKPLAYNLENEFGNGCFHYLSRADEEKIFGLGDKGGSLNKAGRSFKIETTDCMGYDASSTDPLYKHIPFYICDNSVSSYGVFYDTSDTSYFDFGREINNYYEHYKFFKTEDNCLVYYVFFGSKLDIIKQFSALSGKQAFPPRWSFDYCASTMAYTDAPDSNDQMNAFLDKVNELGISCSGFYLSSGYTSIGNQRCVFNWNYDKFPNPKAFVEKFNANGVNLIPNIKPAFLNTHPMYDELCKKGYFIKNPDGTPFITQFWDGYGSYLDFTNSDAFDFWKNQVTEKLLDYGMTCTWNDNNEFDIKDNEALTVNGINACRIRPSLTYLMNASSYSAQIQKNPNLRPFLSTRSGGIGVRRLAQTWSGDNRTYFEDLRFCHFIGLTMSMSGLFFYGHDLGGFSGDMPSRELLLRWLQHGLFEPRMTIHSWNADGSATMPWSYPDIVPAVKKIFAQRKRLQPYFYNCAYRAVYKDEPINAPVFLYYDDNNIATDSDSLMLGRDILAGFVFDEGCDTVSVYLPKGDNWYLGNKLYNGGETVELTIPAESEMPYFVKAGSVIPTNDADYGFNNSNEDIVLNIYPIENGSFNAEFFYDDGVSFDYQNGKCVMLDITVTCNDSNVIVEYKNNGKMDFIPKFKLCSADNRNLIVK